MESERLKYLLDRLAAQTVLPEEKRELTAFLKDDSFDEQVQAFILQNLYTESSEKLPEEAAAATLEAIFSIPAALAGERSAALGGRRVLLRWMAAAVILGAVGSCALYMLLMHRDKPGHETSKVVKTADLPPGSDKAVLTLADGSAVTLDSAGRSSFVQGQAQVQQQGNGLVYHQQGAGAAVSMNKLTTPRGGRFHVVLADGTQVWLNAASSISYPAAFSGDSRKVAVTGEAYLEVAKDSHKPFLVEIDGKALVEVLGTSINVNAYGDEGNIKTTLLEGRVRVGQTGTANSSIVLQPGMQAVGAGNDTRAVKADVEEVMAWKNGVFVFHNAALPGVMKQLERWYDIDVQYEGKIPRLPLSGEMDRGVMLSAVIQFLSDYGIHTRLQNKTLIVE